jgi:uncharacterized protein YecE (DUF72 family)
MITIGTAGYSYEDWRGAFYPANLSSRDYLSYYAGTFQFVEVNVTFYQMPNRHMLYHMAEKTPTGFEFSVKAFRGFTHERVDDDQQFVLFREALMPLTDTGRLACVVAQFPNSFRNNPLNQAYLRSLRARLGGLPIAVEFRHSSWLNEQVSQLLRDEEMGFVCVDEPQLPGLVPPVARATAAPAYVRFHGRNTAKWWRHEAAHERYDYLYTAEELSEWVPKLRELEAKVGKVLVAMNNHYQAKAVSNGKMLQGLLGLS